MWGWTGGSAQPGSQPGSARRSDSDVCNGQAAATEGGALPVTPTRCNLSEQLVAVSSAALLSRLPKQEDSPVSLPLGAVVTPALRRGAPAAPAAAGASGGGDEAASRSLPTVLGEPPACGACGAWFSCYSPWDSSTGDWRCNFCQHFNTGGEKGAAASAARSAAAASEAVDWVAPPPPGTPSPGAGFLALVIDTCMEQPQLDVTKSALLQSLYAMHSSLRVALLTCGSRSVCAYRLARQPVEVLNSPRQLKTEEGEEDGQEADTPAMTESDVLPGDGEFGAGTGGRW